MFLIKRGDENLLFFIFRINPYLKIIISPVCLLCNRGVLFLGISPTGKSRLPNKAELNLINNAYLRFKLILFSLFMLRPHTADKSVRRL